MIRIPERDAARMPKVDDLRPASWIEPSILFRQRGRRGGTRYEIVPSFAAAAAMTARGWHTWRQVMAASDADITLVLKSIRRQAREQVLDLVGNLRSWESAEPGTKIPLHSWEEGSWRKDMEEHERRLQERLLEPEIKSQHGVFLDLSELRLIERLLRDRPEAAAGTALPKIAEAAASMAEMEAIEIDPGFDSVVWNEIETGGGYRVRITSDRLTRCTKTVWKRWDATVIGVQISVCDHGGGMLQAWRNLETEPVYLCESWSDLEELKRAAYHKVMASLPGVMPGGVMREKVERLDMGEAGAGAIAIEYKVLDDGVAG